MRNESQTTCHIVSCSFVRSFIRVLVCSFVRSKHLMGGLRLPDPLSTEKKFNLAASPQGALSTEEKLVGSAKSNRILLKICDLAEHFSKHELAVSSPCGKCGKCAAVR